MVRIGLSGALVIAAIGAGTAWPSSAAPPKAAAPVMPASSSRLDLNGTWQFAFARDGAAADALAVDWRAGADMSGFQPVPVPSNWAMQGYEPLHYKPYKPGETAGEGFYVREFTLPAGWAKQRAVLHLDGVWSSAEIWLNGKPLGRHDSGFTPYMADITDALKAEGLNRLAVRVRQVQHDYLFDTNDDWTLGGIYRDVWLEGMPAERWIDRIETRTTFDSQYRDAELGVRVMIGDRHKQVALGNVPDQGEVPYTIRLNLADADGRVVGAQEVVVHSSYGTDRETPVTLHLEHPRQWTAETPNLYRLTVELLEEGRVAHKRTVPVGLRQISTAGGTFRINGQAVKLRGVNRHDEHPDVGRATTRAQWLEDIRLMKAANINYIRFAHYPPAEGFIDLCDELGMYVSDEVSMGGGGDLMNDPSFSGAAMLRSYETVARDINHPSVVIWSIGNEDPLTSLHLASIRMVKALDPSRPVLMPWRTEPWLPPEIDILAPHYLTARRYDELAGSVSRPVLTTEFTHGYGNDGLGGLQSRWKALTRHPNGVGGAIWMWADQGLNAAERKPDGTIAKSLVLKTDGWDGIVDSYRKPTRDYWEAKAVYAPVFPAVDAVSVSVGQGIVRIPIRNDQDFTDLKAIGIGWTLMADDKELAAGESRIDAAPHAAADLQIPLRALPDAKSGRTDHVRLIFRRADGSEIDRRSVELIRPATHAPEPPAAPRVQVEQGATLTVRAGVATYMFDRQTGYVSAARDSKPFLLDMKPTLWRPLNANERRYLKAGAADWPDLNGYVARASDWQVEETSEGARIRVSVDYRIDGKNSFRATYTYRVDGRGRLDVQYAITPTVQVASLPLVGMSAMAASPVDRIRWSGLGPFDTWPGARAAGSLGVWSEAPPQGDTLSMKEARWAEIADKAGAHFRIEQPDHISLDAKVPGRLQILSSVRERPSGWAPEGPDNLLETSGSFTGGFSIVP